MMLNTEPVNRAQTVFNGARCEFEVERSIDEETEVYSSRLRNCGSDTDYTVRSFFEIQLNKHGKLRHVNNKKGTDIKYLELSDAAISSDQGPNVTINTLAMKKKNVHLGYVHFYVEVTSVQPQQDIYDFFVWGTTII
jgi:hypothetical protein